MLQTSAGMKIDMAMLATVTGGQQVKVYSNTPEQIKTRERCIADVKKAPWWQFWKSEEGCWQSHLDAIGFDRK